MIVDEHVRADMMQAIEDAIGALPIVAAVYDFVANQTPRPPKGKVMVELAFLEEGENVRVDGPGLPRDTVLRRPLLLGARITGAMQKDFGSKDFERKALGPIEVAVANCTALEPLCDDWMLNGVNWDPAQDSAVETLSALVAWKLTYTTAAGAPGKAI